ncbi:hypothetical protein GJ688_15370 [Heliobacillus mobilis]|uniref:Uncharacterized protein n=1 Tax=Heliobacterium mobile TaxID=28064 RepID=A0A6I3SN75_HELMO|nr:hypothetical protein [Heliobacterium mobile]MTV50349.1 hypothetical protein [Heliobacterium mobile]
MYPLILRLGSPVSLVIQFIDDFTAESPLDDHIHVSIAGISACPIRKPGGTFVFTKLPEKSFDVVVRSDFYLSCSFPVELSQLDPKNPVIIVKLIPAPAYPFPSGSTVVRTRVQDHKGIALSNVSVQGTILSVNCARARLVPLGGKDSENEFALMNVLGRILPEDRFLIKARENGYAEQAQVVSYAKDQRRVRFRNPLEHRYGPGTLLLPIFETRSDSRGEAVLYFRHPSSRRFDAQIEFTISPDGSEEPRSLLQEISLEDGKEVNLAVVRL